MKIQWPFHFKIMPLAWISVLFSIWSFAGQASAGDISFNRDIRPILSDRCYYCHGFDENHREADLRLDLREEAEYVFDTDAPDDSELIRRITSEDPDEVMPPPDAHKEAITDDEFALIRRWIQQGAEYEPHWAFVAPQRAKSEAKSIADAVDDFVGRQHAKHDLDFAPPAQPTKWLRRVSLDLTGLPPTLAELDAFSKAVETDGEVVYGRAVDRLFASPHYGERMALEWLDVARYADTNGFQMDAYRMNWPWRDWTIRAFNDNMPFDQFTIEQLAGDLLKNKDGSGPTQDQMIATAFNRNHMINGEGGAIREENLAKNNFDRVETTGTTWMGLTVGCCQCHDHKFDPLKQTDYFSLLSFFNQIDETGMASKKFTAKPDGKPFAKNYWVDKPYIAVSDETLDRKLADAHEGVKAAEKELSQRSEEYIKEARQWVQEMRDDPKLIEGRIKASDYVSRFINNANLDNPKENGFKQLIDFFLDRTEPWKSYQDRISKARMLESTIQEQIPLVMVMRNDKPRDTFVMLRGNYETLGEKVEPTVPDFLPPLPSDAEKLDADQAKPDRLTPDRLTFARWLVSEEHPLTSRVTVNRYWQLMFGRGIVKTPDDFGMQGALPTHPELQDWLAVEFRESGWDVQALLKGIVLSRTYRQTAMVNRSVIAADPENIWLARGTRQRLDSRLLRDQALALSGLLVPDVGGPPVAPYQPGGVWEAMSLNKNHYMQEDGDALYRRSLYTVWRRVVAPTNFFDVPSRQSCSVTLQRTSTPLHALTTLNDKTYIEAARFWADRLSMLPGDSVRLKRLFYAATARIPDNAELETLQSVLDLARSRFTKNAAEASEFIAMGEAENRSNLDPSEHAAWTTVCLLVLNLDETLCK